MSYAKSSAWKSAAVWALRLLAGLTFVVSGWAKLVDPYGFVYKIGDYLSAWGLDGLLPQEFVLVGAVSLSMYEFITGALLATGSWRRYAPICALALMAFMLPLTAYIAIANPVADCGCFGDFIVMSNPATLFKNVVLTVALILLLAWNRPVGQLVRPGLQCGVIIISGIFALTVSFVGWNYQPVIDFRPYPVGAALWSESAESEALPVYIYEKDGSTREFTLDALPDSTWTFVEASEPEAVAEQLAVFDGDDEVTEELFADAKGEMLILVISEPDIDYLTRARFANELYEYVRKEGIEMFAIVASSDQTLELWKEYARPAFEVYSASDTSLKQLARGAMALVMLRDGRVAWKRNFANLYPEILEEEEPLEAVVVFDDGRAAMWLMLTFLASLVVLIFVSLLSSKGSEKKKTNDTNHTAPTVA